MLDQHQQLRDRTQSFSFRIIRLVKSLPRGQEADVFGKQLLRSGTSIAANYRAVGCCRTKAEFVNKLRVVLEEADETVYWLHCIRESGSIANDRMDPILNEAKQIAAIFGASLRTARGRSQSPEDRSRRLPDDQMSG